MKKNSFLSLATVFILIFTMVWAGNIIYERTDGRLPFITKISEATMENGRELILVNSEYRVPDDFQPELITLSNGEKVDKTMYPFLQKMFDDMRKKGLYPTVVSGYRSEKSQESIFEEKYQQYIGEGHSNRKAKELALEWVAYPGTSEHHLGLAVDINPDREKSGNEVYEWLKDNAHKYGFIKRYPSDKTEITGISNEPWHYRYVGKEAAKEMYENNLCLEEYIERINRHY